MLSRIAESLFWIGRYVERADVTARILDVQTQLLIEDPFVDEEESCRLLLGIMGVEHDGPVDQRVMLRLLLSDGSSDSSIVATLGAARESARRARETLSTDMWSAINTTWRQYLACVNAGDQARMFALLSDKMVRRQFVVDIAFGVTEEALFAYLAATPVPLEPDQGAEFLPAADARVLSDGRVAVVGPGDAGRGDVRIFIKEDDRWLLDDWFDLA